MLKIICTDSTEIILLDFISKLAFSLSFHGNFFYIVPSPIDFLRFARDVLCINFTDSILIYARTEHKLSG